MAAPEDPMPFGPGSLGFWINSYDGATDRYSEKVMSQGEGFEIYQVSSEYRSGEASDYYALFSGTYYASCDEDMPNAEDRAELKDLLPLAPEKTADIGAADDGTLISVLAPTEFFLMGRNWPAHSVKIQYRGEDPNEETVTVLDALPLTVRIDWDDDSRDTLLLVTKPTSIAPDLDKSLIGNCASLLNE